MKKKRIFSALAALLMCLSLPVFASASETVEPRFASGVRWEDCPSTVYFSCSDNIQNSYKTVIRLAMNKWNAVKTPNGGSMITLSLDDINGYNEIRYDYIESGAPGYMECDDTLGEDPEIGPVFLYTDILLSEDVRWSTTGASNAYDVLTVVEHELGHALGVAHCHEPNTRTKCYSSTCLKNVMNPNITIGQKRTTLQEYDKSSYTLIYW